MAVGDYFVNGILVRQDGAVYTTTTANMAELAASSGSSLVGFLQSGTGATSRTVQARLRDVISVKDFGATGNGTTDDTTAINNAITQCVVEPLADGYGTAALYFPGGTYQISSQIQIPNHCVILGAGSRTTRIRVSTNFSGLSTTGALRSGNGTANVFSVWLKDFLLEVGAFTSSVGIFSADFQNDCGIESVIVNNFAGYGVRLNGSTGFIGSVNEFSLRNVSCFKAATGSVGGYGISIENGSYAGDISQCQCTSQDSLSGLTAAYQVLSHNAWFNSCFAETYGTNGFLFGSGASGGVVGSVVNGTWTNAHHILAGAQRVTLIQARRGSAGNNIVNDITGQTITDTIVPAYITGSGVIIDGADGLAMYAPIYPATPNLQRQTGGAWYAGAGVPNDAQGSNGDFYSRTDGTVAGNTVMYHKEGGIWIAFTTT